MPNYKAIQISYQAGTEVHTVWGKNRDVTLRKVLDENGVSVHSVSSRLTMGLMVERCIERGVPMLTLIDRGRVIYSVEGAPVVEVKTETLPAEAYEVQRAAYQELVKPEPSGVFAQMAQELKPYLDEALKTKLDESKVNELIEQKLKDMPVGNTIAIKKLDGTTKKLGLQHKSFADLLMFVQARINVLIVGAAGGGKTHSAQEVCKALDLPFYSISVGAMTTKTDFLGYMNAQGEYVSTMFRRALEFGGGFMLDEMDAGNSNVLTTINMALANSEAAFPDGMVKKHPDFVLMAGANTYGTGGDTDYVGRNKLDAATLDRFAVLNWDYDHAIEEHISIDERWTRYVQAVRANLSKSKTKMIISPRASVMGGLMLSQGMSLSKVKKTCLFKSLPSDDVRLITEGVTF